LLEVTQLTSRSAAPLPALGMAGGHPDFERRLIMIMRDRVPCRVPVLGLAFIGLLALVALPSWSLSQQPVEAKTEIKKVDKKVEKPSNPTEENFVEVILESDPVQVRKAGSESDRLDRVEKQLEALLQEVKAMRSGSGQKAGKDVTVEVKPAVKTYTLKDSDTVHQVGPRVLTAQPGSGNVHGYTWVTTSEGEHAVALTRATYKMPKEKAEALAKFLSDQVKGQVLETKVESEGIVVTTTPQIQRTIHDFINLVQGGKQNYTFEIKGAELEISKPTQGK